VLRYKTPAPSGGSSSPKVVSRSAVEGWKPSELKPGAKLNPPAPLFKKLEEKVVEEERARLGK
jgi:methionyl-tRNA synthetase